MQRRKFIKKTSLLSMGLGITNNALSNVQKQKVNLTEMHYLLLSQLGM